MFKPNTPLALIVAALALALGSGLMVNQGHAAIPENASSHLDQLHSVP